MKRSLFLLFSLPLAATAGTANRTEYLNKLPLRFEESRGRDPHEGTQYVARAQGFRLGLAPSGNWLEWSDASGTKTASV